MPDAAVTEVVRVVPSRRLLRAWLACAGAILVLLVAGVEVQLAGWLALGAGGGLALLAVADARLTRAAWRRAVPTLTRRLPAAFAIAAQRRIGLTIDNAGPHAWHCELFDHADGSLATEGLPVSFVLPPASRVETHYQVTPERRGDVAFTAASVRLRSRLGLLDAHAAIGPVEERRVYPDFAQVSRYAWLAGNRRLQEIGIKTYQQRGQGTDFKQLSEYRQGDSIRHIDWRATLRLDQPIVRQFQDERDQSVLLLLDCGRRMRAEEAHVRGGGGHFDHVLNAVMLLTYVALKQGDAVGALTCGAAEGRERSVAPRKGAHALNGLMSELYDLQPTLMHADYLAAAQQLLGQHPKRALVVLITNFRDEDSTELQHALRLLRSRHLVLVASVREQVIDQMLTRPMETVDDSMAVASAHLYRQARQDSFNRLAARDALMVDALPERLGIELVNRYHAVKRAGLM